MGNIKKHRSYIFLDLDGPVIPFSYPDNISPHAIPEDVFPFNSRMDDTAKGFIEKLCEEFDATIIVNSTHNSPSFGGWEHVQRLFECNKIRHLLEDKTRFKNGIENRLEAVADYLNYRPREFFVILDDDYRHFEQKTPASKHYVQTGYYGMVSEQYEKAKEILRGNIEIQK